MSSSLVVTLFDGTTEKFILASSNYGQEWRYRSENGLLYIVQGRESTTFPLTSVLKWEVAGS
jgi:hypothetical protein